MKAWQGFVAAEWPSRIFVVVVGAAWLAYLSIHVPAWRELASVSTSLAFLGLAAATFAVAAGVALIAGSLLLSPIYLFQASKNGAPFEPGDEVRVLSGRAKGRAAFVYSAWQGNSVRVDLGESAKKKFADIYGSFQLELIRRKDSVAIENAPDSTLQPSGR